MYNLISFFTRIPAQGDLSKASKELFLLPLLAFLIALVPISVYFVSHLLFSKLFTSFFALIGIYLVTGLLHLDGLADFADGLMTKGSRLNKIRALKDTNTGVAGAFSMMVVFGTEFIAIYSIPYSFLNLTLFFVVGELSAKMSMLVGLLSNKAPDTGIAKEFMKYYGGKRFLIAILVSLVFLPILRSYYFLQFLGAIIALILIYVALHNFGFVNGDVLGAMNEIARAVTMVVLCLVL